MINEKNFKDMITIALIICLFFLTVLILKPIIISIISGILLAYLFHSIYKWTVKKIKYENLSALLICILLIIIILVPLVFIFNSLIGQAVNVYLSLQDLDFSTVIANILPSSVSSSQLFLTLAKSLDSFIPKILSYLITKFGGTVLNLPAIFLQIFVVLFIFFFSLRDGQKGIEYLKSLSPFKKETSERFFGQFRNITNSVLLGQIVIGVIQGIVAGIGYYIFGVPYVLFLTLITILAGIIPLIGPWIIWIPLDIYLFSTGKSGAGLGLLIYGTLIISWIDNLIKPLILSKKTEINSAIVIIGMIGGIFMFGVIGLILGPLILGYVLLVIELYRKNKFDESILFKN